MMVVTCAANDHDTRNHDANKHSSSRENDQHVMNPMATMRVAPVWRGADWWPRALGGVVIT